jgi:hypothetical protein
LCSIQLFDRSDRSGRVNGNRPKTIALAKPKKRQYACALQKPRVITINQTKGIKQTQKSPVNLSEKFNRTIKYLYYENNYQHAARIINYIHTKPLFLKFGFSDSFQIFYQFIGYRLDSDVVKSIQCAVWTRVYLSMCASG